MTSLVVLSSSSSASCCRLQATTAFLTTRTTSFSRVCSNHNKRKLFMTTTTINAPPPTTTTTRRTITISPSITHNRNRIRSSLWRENTSSCQSASRIVYGDTNRRDCRSRLFGSNRRSSSGNHTNKNGSDGGGRRRRTRYAPKGTIPKTSPPSSTKTTKDSPQRKKIVLPPPPEITSNGLFPYYYSCRHTYEPVLMEEIQRRVLLLAAAAAGRGSSSSTTTTTIEDHPSLVSTTSPMPGLVRVDILGDDQEEIKQTILNELDPIYALQTIPNCQIITAPSIKQLAIQGIETMLERKMDDKENSKLLRNAPRGSLAIHCLVPGVFKGIQEKNLILYNRVQNISKEMNHLLKKQYGYKCAKSPAEQETNTNHEKWLLQLVLFSPEILGVSLTQCKHPFSSCKDTVVDDARISSSSNSCWSTSPTWPNWYHPAGFAKVDITDHVMPSSAYRKLLEAMEYIFPTSTTTTKNSPIVPDIVVDLGACPGGWTKTFRIVFPKKQCKIISVDRSELDPELMKDPNIQFIQGDAFSYRPPWAAAAAAKEEDRTTTRNNKNNIWMVSDVIAYPERIVELIHTWCRGDHLWANYMIITCKFQGDTIPWDILDDIQQRIHKDGYYQCRIKHFFNNKNEVTIMIVPAANPPTI